MRRGWEWNNEAGSQRKHEWSSFLPPPSASHVHGIVCTRLPLLVTFKMFGCLLIRGGIFHLRVRHGKKEKQQKTGLPLLGELPFGKIWRTARRRPPRSRSETRLLGLRSRECELLWVPTFICRIKKVKKKSNKLNACAAWAASVRVLGCYQGLKIHRGGVGRPGKEKPSRINV